eukprot:TRINITY_DN116215_c0_g1_i1.p1 TRINITY_DN116215_c0_g1~~TRINITY_DN116215_c0_g1_i1.p1  ORF type:complete len:256 (-),score=14.23 TRINITY_DN116215_c0_g1_i1:21-725(-)
MVYLYFFILIVLTVAQDECDTSYVTLDGICCEAAKQYNQIYTFKGHTLDGRPYYQGENGGWLFYDQDCASAGSGWLVGCNEPDVTAESNLQHGEQGDCCNWAQNHNSSMIPPVESKGWAYVFCGWKDKSGGGISGDTSHIELRECKHQIRPTADCTARTYTTYTETETESGIAVMTMIIIGIISVLVVTAVVVVAIVLAFIVLRQPQRPVSLPVTAIAVPTSPKWDKQGYQEQL